MYSTAFMGLMGGGGLNNLFSVTPYTGNGSTQSIVTGQNLAAGGLAWTKTTNVVSDHPILDTVRGTSALLRANQTVAENTSAVRITSFNSNGITLNSDGEFNSTGSNQILFSWLEQAGYMDVVLYSGNGSGAGQSIAHNLGAVPQLIIIKNRTNAQEWPVYHVSIGSGQKTVLNTTAAKSASNFFGTQTSSNIVLGDGSGEINAAANNYVAYLFAEKAGKSKFGSYVGTGVSGSVLVSGMGFTAKAMLVKRTDSSSNGDWWLLYKEGNSVKYVVPNTTAQAFTYSTDAVFGDGTFVSAGAGANTNGATYIYAAWG